MVFNTLLSIKLFDYQVFIKNVLKNISYFTLYKLI